MELIVIFGPPAVGKMTVGDALCQTTGFRLFHNHMTIEPLVGIFPFGSAPFDRLVNEFRRRIIEEAAKSDLRGLDLPEDADLVADYAEIVHAHGGRVRFVELFSDLPVRLARNTTALRLERKPSRRDLDASRDSLLRLDREHILNTGGPIAPAAKELLDRHDYIRVDNSDLSPSDVAAMVMRQFGLPAVADTA